MKEGEPMAPINSLVTPLLTDAYQITMAYAYWKNGMHEQTSVFDLFFRKNPFNGEYTVFSGLDQALALLSSFRFTAEHIAYLKDSLHLEDGFLEYLRSLDCSRVRVYSPCEGEIVFPRIPLLRVEGPLAVCQLLETPLLTLINFASLVATNATRMRLAAGPEKTLLEFGLRRAQGPDGGVTASRSALIGGFDGTSNVAAGFVYDIPIKGTHAHAFVTSFTSLDEVKIRTLEPKAGGEAVDFVDLVLKKRDLLQYQDTHEGELAAFIAYSTCYPNSCLNLVDTYDTLTTGVPNFLCVAFALMDLGYTPLGIRLDSGDLSYLSKKSRELFKEAGALMKADVSGLKIAASNDLNEDTIISLAIQGHEIDIFGIGTNLVTCQKQPALGCVFKLVELDGKARIKISNEIAKIPIPGKKRIFRLYGSEGHSIIDMLTTYDEADSVPVAGKKILARHPFESHKRVYVVPNKVEELLHLVFDGKIVTDNLTVEKARSVREKGITALREDHHRAMNPTPYKVALTEHLYNFMHNLWMENAPVHQLS